MCTVYYLVVVLAYPNGVFRKSHKVLQEISDVFSGYPELIDGFKGLLSYAKTELESRDIKTEEVCCFLAK